ncbi:MAG TPA: glucose-6-phosphate dehydrogenase assembly protein OpcA [Pyrinomonadaceae bacterium]|nr:glucose-6-phosphate dehydrogenase assembly protein OpcA [Pyrinomonadaceae bacterium]
METQSSTVQLSALKGIDAARLESELSAMWAEASGGGEGRAGVVRACVLNLVVYAEGAEERDEVDALLGEVIERHPCRAVVLVADRESQEPRLEAYVSTRCQLSSRGGKQVCGEQITIEAGGPVVESAATAVAPLLVPDVPVFLWWKDIPHYEDKLFNRLAEMADRVVIDSATFDNPHFDLARLAEILRERAGSLRLTDLNWGRLTSWRSLVASFWDVPEYRPSLAEIERVEIVYDPPDRSPGDLAPKALLAAGWMAACLGWQLDPDGGSRDSSETAFELKAGGRRRRVRLALRAGEQAAGRDGMITSLTLSTARGDQFYVRLRPDEAKLETCATFGDGSPAVSRVLGLEARSEGRRLSAELDLLDRDRLYEQAVEFAARMLEIPQSG